MLFHHPTADLQPVVHPQGARRAFVEGIVVEAFNVKTALFFMAFLPQFVSFDMPVGPQLVLLGCICVALNTLVDVLAVMWADRLLRSSVVQASRARILNYFSGCTMVALGVFLATARRSD
jgi:threonine/homoserine/homoserine lactone efflux protein